VFEVDQPILRSEDPPLLTGRGRFVDDIVLPGALFMKFVRSTEAHARIIGIDVQESCALAGVVGVWTAETLGDLPGLPGLPGLERPVLAKDKVRYVGEPIAVVVACDAYVAEDAAECVDIDYEALPAVCSVQDALRPDAPRIFESLDGNVVFELPADADVEGALARAPRRRSVRMVHNRCSAAPMEPVACLADWEGAGVTLYAGFQAPHLLRNKLAEWLGISQNACRVVSPDVGGAFGSKIVFYPELFVAPLLSRILGRPIKATLTRSEAFTHMSHGRDQVHDIDVGYDHDGRLQALRLLVFQNVGAWPDPVGAKVATRTVYMAAGCYKIPHVAAGFRDVVTNTTPIAAYRGAGRPEAAFMIERVIDMVADDVGVDAAEVRRRNFIKADDFPYATHFPGIEYDVGDYDALLDKLLDQVDYDGLLLEQARRRLDPDERLLGIGLSTWVENSATGPRGSLEGFGMLGSWESSEAYFQPDGSLTITVGSAAHGQGHKTTFAQIASDALCVPFADITILAGDTGRGPEGIGTMGSRSIAIGGSSVKKLSQRLADRGRRIAAHLLECDEGDLVLRDGGFQVTGSPFTQLPWREVCRASFQPSRLPEGMEPGELYGRVYEEVFAYNFPSGAYCCVVEVDRETGDIELRRLSMVDDCGNVISPRLVEGQIHGGAAQGIGQALFEEILYDSIGQPLSASFMSYMIPGAPDVPDFETSRLSTPTSTNALGAKGAGEAGAVGTPPAVVNAVVDALSHLGVDHFDMPVTSEKVWRALAGASGAANTGERSPDL
jgi:carbon-monoxide dehydrogenase large subunit